MRVLPMGDRAALVADLERSPAAWAAAFAATAAGEVIDGVVEIVPGADTVLIECADPAALALATAVAERTPSLPAIDVAGHEIRFEVHYGGDDLDDVARRAGCSTDDVVGWHAESTYTVAFMGFAPGFGYLAGLPERLHLPRRSSPRTRVPAGAVAIAGRYSAVYPTESPGGWHLIGRVERTLFDPAADPPALLSPGATVRFVPA